MSPQQRTSGAPDAADATDATGTAVPFLRVERGTATAEELAAITATLAAVASSSSGHGPNGDPHSDRASRRSGVKWGSTWHSLHPGWVRGRGWVGW